MKKTNLVFHINHFAKGGIEASLVSWLNILDRERFSIILSVGYQTSYFEHYRNRIPTDVKVNFLLTEPWLIKAREKKCHGRLTIWDNIKEGLVAPFRKIILRKRFEKIAKHADVVKDFDLSLGRFYQPTVPFIGYYHFDFDDLAQRFPSRYLKARQRFPRYNRIITLSKSMQASGERLFPEIKDRVEFIYNSFNLENLRHRANEDFAQPEFPYIVAVGSLDARKNFQLLIRAFASLVKQQDVAEHLIIIGEGELKNSLLNLAAELGVKNKVHLLGFKPNALPYIKHAQLFVLSSNMEGLPTVLIEALALGEAIISTDCPTGPQEILDHGKAGILVPMNDATAMAGAMLTILKDTALQQKFQHQALQQAEVFNAATGSEALANIIDKVVPAKLNIAISRTDGLGDVILTLPMAGWLKQHYPNATIIFFCKQYTQAIVDLCPYVDKSVNWDELVKLPSEEIVATIKSLHIDIFIHAFPQSKIAKIVKQAKIKTRLGTAGRLYNWFYCNKLVFFSRARSNLHESQLNMKLLAPLGLKDNLTVKQVQNFLKLNVKPSVDITSISHLLDKQRFNLIIHPGSHGNGREWPPGYFVELIRRLSPEKFKIFLTGSAAEKVNFQHNLIDQCPTAVDLMGKLSLSELAAFISQANGLLAASTGPLHLAAALGIHALGLYSPRQTASPSRWAPLGERAQYLVFDKDCNQPCTNTDCQCMRNISVKQVYDVIEPWALEAGKE